MKEEALKFLKGVFIGGFFSLVSLCFLVALIIQLAPENRSVFWLVVFSFGLACSSLGALWGAGFWGRWGLVLFFAFAPIVLITDFSLNPFFPSGTIFIAVVCCWPRGQKHVHT